MLDAFIIDKLKEHRRIREIVSQIPARIERNDDLYEGPQRYKRNNGSSEDRRGYTVVDFSLSGTNEPQPNVIREQLKYRNLEYQC